VSEEKVLTKKYIEDNLDEILERCDALLFFEFTKITDEAAEYIREKSIEYGLGSCDLSLYDIKEISDEAIMSLAQAEVYQITLQIKSISVPALEALLKTNVIVSLDDITKLTPEEANLISQLNWWSGELKLAIGTLKPEIAVALAGFCGEAIVLPKLNKLSDEAVEALSNFQGARLELPRVRELSDAAAESLNKYKGFLKLNLDNLPESAAQILRDAGHGV
tara:strand:- start:43 stop:705 length:663 start_codon:yes stop_codon:yes gene_type:complete